MFLRILPGGAVFTSVKCTASHCSDFKASSYTFAPPITNTFSMISLHSPVDNVSSASSIGARGTPSGKRPCAALRVESRRGHRFLYSISHALAHWRLKPRSTSPVTGETSPESIPGFPSHDDCVSSSVSRRPRLRFENVSSLPEISTVKFGSFNPPSSSGKRPRLRLFQIIFSRRRVHHHRRFLINGRRSSTSRLA